MKTKAILFTILLALAALTARADSPLTSTEFANVYADNEMVQLAIQLEGDLNTTLLNYLADPKSPVDVRVAIINAASWKFEGKSTGNQLLTYLLGRYKVKNEEKLAKKIDAGTLITYAYAKAMSDYFNVDKALEIAETAVKKNKTRSFTVDFIAALIRAQKYLDSDWAAVYTTVNNVLNDGSLRLDMRQGAIDAVMEYIGLYKEYVDKTQN